MMTSDSELSDTDLHTAVRYGDIKEVRQALRCRLSPNKIGLYKWTPLHEAASNGYSDIVKLLLLHGGDPNAADRLCGNTSVHYAAQEGHYSCLGSLLDAGGDYSRPNDEGESALQVATRMCQRIIEKKRVERLMKMHKEEAKHDAVQNLQRISEALPPPLTESRAPISADLDIQTSETTERVKAWSPQIHDSSAGTMGQLHVSFEYHSKKNSLKVRLWRLSGLMMSPSQSSMINTVYVKSSLVPDTGKQSKRRSEEIKVQPVLSALAQSKKGNLQSYVTDSGTEVVFQPVTFKFSKPLVYETITPEIVAEKIILIRVSLKQKYTHWKYMIGDLTLPLSVAVTKIVKESFPLRAQPNTALPESMLVLPEIKNKASTASDPNLRVGISPAPSRSMRPASDVNLREILSVSSHSPSVSIDMPFEEEEDEFCEVKVESLPTNRNIAIRMGEPNDNGDESVELPSVISVESVENPPSPDVRITVTNADSDSSDTDDAATSHQSSILSKLKKRTRSSGSSTDVTNLLEEGKITTQSGVDNSSFSPSLTSLTENSKLKLKPKVSQSNPQNRSKRNMSAAETETSYSRSLRGSDVIVSVDLELEDLESSAPFKNSRSKYNIDESPA